MLVARPRGVDGLRFDIEDDQELWAADRSVRDFLEALSRECEQNPFGGRDDAGGEDLVLDLRRPAYFAVGVEEDEYGSIVRVRRGLYLHLLMTSPMVNPRVEQYLERRWTRCHKSWSQRPFASALGQSLSTLGEFRRDPHRFLEPDGVARTIADLGWPRPLPLGVAGAVVLEGEPKGEQCLLGAMRSARVAIAVDALGPTVDGGLAPRPGALTEELLAEGLRTEADDEMEGLPDLSWSFAGISVVDDVRRSGGLTFLFVARLPAEDASIPDRPAHFEARQFVRLPLDDGGLAPEHRTTATQALLDIADSLVVPQRSVGSFRLGTDAAQVAAARTPRREYGRSERTMATQTLEDRFSDDLLGGFPRLDRVSLAGRASSDGDAERLRNIAEDLAGNPTEQHLLDALDVLLRVQLEYRLAVRGTDRAALRQGRLFEALIYRIARELLLGTMRSADKLLEMLDNEAHEIEHCGRIGERWTSVKRDMIAQHEDGRTHDLTADDIEALERWDARERALGFNPIATELRLLIFCSKIWIMEALSSVGGFMLVLTEKYRRAFGSNPDALQFKARALLIDPVLPDYRIMLGRQFVSTALREHAENAGVWHTLALYEMRAASTSIWPSRQDGLGAALEAVRCAIERDPEFPTFYRTRAAIEKQLGFDGAARVNLEAAIELSRFLLGAEAASQQTTDWVRLLESWR